MEMIIKKTYVGETLFGCNKIERLKIVLVLEEKYVDSNISFEHQKLISEREGGSLQTS